MERICRSFVAVLAVVFLSATAAFAADPAMKCESGKLKESSRYGACRLKAESRGVRKGIAPDFAKCETKFTKKFNEAETMGGPGVCPSESDEASMKTLRKFGNAGGIEWALEQMRDILGDLEARADGAQA